MNHRFGTRAAGRRRRVGARPGVESLEGRQLLASVAVDAASAIRPANNQLLGVNLAWWDTNLTTAKTQSLVKDAGLTLFRFPGGSSSDEYHFSDPPSYPGKGTVPDFAKFVESVGGTGLVTLDYGSGSPQEAAAFLAYLNAPVGNTTAIGVGGRWSDASQSWVATDWKSANDWATLRASTPLAQDDGRNFLRIGHAAPFGFHDYEVGNELYGSWETDHHGQGGDAGRPHDPATYVAFARQFAALASTIDPSISIGVDTGSVGEDNNWTRNVLTIGAAQGFVPGFLSDHHYMQAPGQESDANLLLNTVSGTGSQNPNNPMSWAARAAGYRTLLQQTLGTNAARVQLLATEFNSVYAGPGKQTTSLVNGLFLADSLGSLLGTEYAGANAWDLRNSYETGNNNSSSLYGWRQGGDYGLLGSPNGSTPASGVYTPYPTYFAEQLVARMVHPGDTVIRATSDDPNLAVYAVKQSSGKVDLLVINKSATADLAGTFAVAGFQPGSVARAWQYGKAQDTAQSRTTDGSSALASFNADLTPVSGGFRYTFPSYSMTVLELTGGGSTGPANAAPTIATPASASPGTVAGKTTALSVLGADDAGESALIYTWALAGTPPAPVSFAANGTNAARMTTATFAAAGTYTFVVTATDAGGLTATSTATVVVNPTATTVVVTPGSATVAAGTTRVFSAVVNDQFGTRLATQPGLAWSVVGVGSINTGGIYSAPGAAGNAEVRASAAGIAGSASVVVTAAPTNPNQGALTATYRTTGDWGSGFTGEVTIANGSATPVSGWTVSFNSTAAITGVWNGIIVSHIGTRYTVTNASYNAAIAPGASTGFGFGANRAGAGGEPTNLSINGSAPTNPAPVGAFDLAASYKVTGDWGSGFTGSVGLANTGTLAVSGWTLAFTFAANITQIWGATIVSRVGNTYVVRDAGYNAAIAPGASAGFGFVASRADGSNGPAIGLLTDVEFASGDRKKRFASLIAS